MVNANNGLDYVGNIVSISIVVRYTIYRESCQPALALSHSTLRLISIYIVRIIINRDSITMLRLKIKIVVT